MSQAIRSFADYAAGAPAPAALSAGLLVTSPRSVLCSLGPAVGTGGRNPSGGDVQPELRDVVPSPLLGRVDRVERVEVDVDDPRRGIRRVGGDPLEQAVWPV